MSAFSIPGRTIRAVIVDDEPLARERLRTLVAEEADIAVIAECADGAGGSLAGTKRGRMARLLLVMPPAAPL